MRDENSLEKRHGLVCDIDLWGSNEEVMAYLRRFKHCAEPPAGITIKYAEIEEDVKNEVK